MNEYRLAQHAVASRCRWAHGPSMGNKYHASVPPLPAPKGRRFRHPKPISLLSGTTGGLENIPQALPFVFDVI